MVPHDVERFGDVCEERVVAGVLHFRDAAVHHAIRSVRHLAAEVVRNPLVPQADTQQRDAVSFGVP
jgi:hypothetical protein